MPEFVTHKELASTKETLVEKIAHEKKNRQQVEKLTESEISDNKTSLSLFEQSQKYMEKKIDNIEVHITEGIKELKKMIEKQNDTFATKKEHKANKDEITEIKDSNKKVLIYIVSLLVSIISSIAYIIISKNI